MVIVTTHSVGRRLHPELSAVVQASSACVLPDINHTLGVAAVDLLFCGDLHNLLEEDNQKQNPRGVSR